MINKRPEVRFERLLTALGQDLIDAPDEEILAMVDEVGLKPDMQGSVALFGVTFAVRKRNYKRSGIHVKKTSNTSGTSRGRRRPKGDAPSST